MEQVDGVLLGHVACTKHGSSDSLALYEKDIDGKRIVDGHCWSECGFISTKELQKLEIIDEGCNVIVDFVTKSCSKPFVMNDEARKKVEDIKDLPSVGWKERGIPTIVSKFYDVRTKKDEQGNVTHRYYPSTEDGVIVGWHVRDDLVKQAKNRGEKIDKPPFFPIGKVRSDCELFGQCKFTTGDKFQRTLILASGEEDAQAIFTALNTENSGGKLSIKKYIIPVVSTTVGESAIKQLKNNYDFLSAFDNVIIMYDNDSAGKEGAEKVAKLLPAGSAKIAKYKLKDACEHSSKGDFDSIRKAYYGAEQFSPVDILHLNQMWDDFECEDNNAKIPFPDSWSTLNEMLNGGMERGEVTVIGGLTSIGKSSFINSIVYNIIENTPYKIGAMYLETTKREVVRDLLSLDIQINLRRVDRSTIDMVSLKRRFFEGLVAKDKFVYVNHCGMLKNHIIFDKLTYLAKVECCDVILLDPLQCAVNSSDNGAIINFMDTILKFAKETDTCVVLVSHMRKPDGDNPHAVSEYHLMGSSSINQIAFNTILLSRDKMNSDSNIKNSTKVHLVKCRRTGMTGDAGWLRYDDKTTHIFATIDPYAKDQEDVDEFLSSGISELKDEDFLVNIAKENSDWEVED